MRSASLLAGSLAMFASIALAQPQIQPQPLRIEGLLVLEPLTLEGVTPVVVGRRLEIRKGNELLLSVQPWPGFLPQRFGRQSLVANRQLLPAGPTDRLSFTHPAEPQPWLVVGTGARQATPLVGAWRLQRNGADWAVSDGASVRRWRPAAPLQVTADGANWCLCLLDTRLPPPQAGIAGEEEPQLAWAGQRSAACAAAP